MKKALTFFLSLTLLVTALSGCTPVHMPNPADPVTLTMWHVYGSHTISPLNTVIDEFNRSPGSEYGITVNVVSVTSSSAIDKALSASANNDPGAEAMPDLFTAYPRVAEIVGVENLLPWDDFFTGDEPSAFHAEFLHPLTVYFQQHAPIMTGQAGRTSCRSTTTTIMRISA